VILFYIVAGIMIAMFVMTAFMFVASDSDMSSKEVVQAGIIIGFACATLAVMFGLAFEGG